MMTFGEKLQRLRKQNGLSQEQLAASLKVSRQAVSKWELDSSLPDTANIILISQLFSTSIDYLLKDDMECDTERSADTLDEQDEAALPKSSFHSIIEMMVGGICVGIGGIGTIVLLVLSTMIEVPVTRKRILPNGRVEYYGGGDVLGYSFRGFIEEYRLQAVLLLLIILVIAGSAVMIMNKIKRRQGSTGR